MKIGWFTMKNFSCGMLEACVRFMPDSTQPSMRFFPAQSQFQCPVEMSVSEFEKTKVFEEPPARLKEEGDECRFTLRRGERV
ncbi:hypothetical protein RJ40_00710 [Methanofollis aquaemaris]|uniref:Uncharacterized protein n=1 Tax=Methanofollis aquaemaris TaxID=126734 RepID=A0A8A3S3D7_9EURY|nr:hypothetical protein [Methanofollis aquaemaris]QSZ66124.1 hypothetical protein RJ40_00710 [Methanofollis aquaemaris]